MTAIHYDNVWARLDDASAQDKQRVKAHLTYRVEGAQFTRAYKLGQWNGQKSVFNWSSQTFPAGLAGEVGRLLGSTLVDGRGIAPAADPYLTERTLEGVSLMQHQDEAVIRIQQATRGVVHHPVGAGKSIVIVEAVRRLGVPALVLVTKKELLHQLFDQFTRLIGREGIGMIGDGTFHPDFVTIATVQTLMRYLNAPKTKHGGIDPQQLAKRATMTELLAQFRGVHIDECHHLPSTSFQTLLGNLPHAYYRVGYSATPMRSGADEQRLLVTGLTGPVISQMTMSDNHEVGRGVEADVFMVGPGGMPPDDYDGTYFNRAGREVPRHSYPKAVETGIIRHEERNAKIVRLAELFGEAGPTLVLTERIEHGMLIRDILSAAGHKEVR